MAIPAYTTAEKMRWLIDSVERLTSGGNYGRGEKSRPAVHDIMLVKAVTDESGGYIDVKFCDSDGVVSGDAYTKKVGPT